MPVSTEPEAAQRHPSVLIAALTFCFGLFVLRVLAGLAGPRFAMALETHGDALLRLQVLSGIATIPYLILRRTEGDFRALFLVSFATFVFSEAAAALIRWYGILVLSDMGLVFNFAMFIYGSLAITACLAEGQPNCPYKRALFMSSLGFVFLGALRIFIDMRRGQFEDPRTQTTTYALAIVTLYTGGVLIWGEYHRSARQKAAPLPPAPDPVVHANEPAEKN